MFLLSRRPYRHWYRLDPCANKNKGKITPNTEHWTLNSDERSPHGSFMGPTTPDRAAILFVNKHTRHIITRNNNIVGDLLLLLFYDSDWTQEAASQPAPPPWSGSYRNIKYQVAVLRAPIKIFIGRHSTNLFTRHSPSWWIGLNGNGMAPVPRCLLRKVVDQVLEIAIQWSLTVIFWQTG